MSSSLDAFAMGNVAPTAAPTDGLGNAAAVDASAGIAASLPTGDDVNLDALRKRGADVYRSMKPEEKKELNSMSGSVHFVCSLGAGKYPQLRTAGGDSKIPSYTLVGLKLKTDVDLEIPQIPFQKPNHDVKTIPDINTIQYKKVPAGSEFVVSRVEAMYLFTMPQYKLNGYCAYGDDPMGFQLAAKTGKLFDTGRAMPTPAFKFTKIKGSIKEGMELVDVKNAQGEWELKPQYAEKFADLLRDRSSAARTDGMPASKQSQGSIVSLAIWEVLKSGSSK